MRGRVYRNSKGQGAPFYVQAYYKGDRIFKRFWKEQDAHTFLAYLAVEAHEETLDVREWQKSNPVGFATLADKYLAEREPDAKSFADIRRHIYLACDQWKQRPAKRITSADFHDFVRNLPPHLSPKSRQNAVKSLNGFFRWCSELEYIDKKPKAPKITANMAMRRIVDKDTQEAIIEEVRRLTSWNSKIWFGVSCLATYVNVRPNELRLVLEGDIDLRAGTVRVLHTKEGRHKTIDLIQEDVDFIRSIPRGLPHLHFFRHETGRKGCAAGEVFGPHYFWYWWRRACSSLGIDGVDLYGGTRHSSVSALADRFTPEEIKKYGTGHVTESFERYFQVSREQRISLAESARRPDVTLNTKIRHIHSKEGLEKTG